MDGTPDTPEPDLVLRSRNEDGTYDETKLTAAQALDVAAGKPIAFAPPRRDDHPSTWTGP